VTTDLATTAHPGSPFRQDVADGLLPQLIDVLQALADGQHLLARRLRDVRLDIASHHNVSGVETSRRTENPQPAEARSSACDRHMVALGFGEENPSDQVEDGDAPTVEGDRNDVPSGPMPAIPEADRTELIAETASSPLPGLPTQVASPAEASRDGLVQTESMTSATHLGSSGSPVNRDYNFFDELDARLADLQNP
jgi:hypothetical protein